MSIRDRILAIVESGEPLWDYGLDIDRASQEALSAWRLLNRSERLIVSKLNPAKDLRDEMIRTLSREFGFRQVVLVQLSGLSRSHISRILQSGAKNRH